MQHIPTKALQHPESTHLASKIIRGTTACGRATTDSGNMGICFRTPKHLTDDLLLFWFCLGHCPICAAALLLGRPLLRNVKGACLKLVPLCCCDSRGEERPGAKEVAILSAYCILQKQLLCGHTQGEQTLQWLALSGQGGCAEE